MEEALTQNFGIRPSQVTLESARQRVPDNCVVEKHLVFRKKLRGLIAAKKSRPATTSNKPADRSALPSAEQYDVYKPVQVLSDETKEKIEGEDSRFVVM